MIKGLQQFFCGMNNYLVFKGCENYCNEGKRQLRQFFCWEGMGNYLVVNEGMRQFFTSEGMRKSLRYDDKRQLMFSFDGVRQFSSRNSLRQFLRCEGNRKLFGCNGN